MWSEIKRRYFSDLEGWLRAALFLVLIVPFLVDYNVFFPFVALKAVFFRGVVAVAAVIFLVAVVTKDELRRKWQKRLEKFGRSSLTWAVLALLAIIIVSTVMATSQFRAFYGDVERSEGLVGLSFFFGWFILTGIVWGKKDWRLFLQGSIVAGGGLILTAFYDIVALQNDRPGGLLGNPLYLSQYFLWTLAASWIVFEEGRKNNLNGSVLGTLGFIISVLGLIITQTRGVFLGIAVAGVALLVFILKSKKLKEEVAVKKVMTGLFLFGLAAVAIIFLVGGKKGILRVVDTRTLNTRLIAIESGLQSISPANEGWKKFLIGWGVDNYYIAHNKYFNPDHFLYESNWFDRAHNKLVDMLVMTGIAGFSIYMWLWIQALAYLWQIRNKDRQAAPLFLFGVAYFTQNIFAFESVAIYIIWLAWLGYVGHRYNLAKETQEQKQGLGAGLKKMREVRVVAGLMAVWFMTAWLAWSLPAYAKMREYTSIIRSNKPVYITNNVQKAFTPYTYSQEDIRRSLFRTVFANMGKGEEINKLAGIMEDAYKEMIERDPYEPMYAYDLGNFYIKTYALTENESYLEAAEEFFRKALALSPNRQQIRYKVAYVLALREEFESAEQLLQETLALNEEVGNTYYYLGVINFFRGEDYYEEAYKYFVEGTKKNTFFREVDSKLEAIYETMLAYYWQKRDGEKFVKLGESLAQVAKTLEHFSKEEEILGMVEEVKRENWEAIKVER